MVCTPGAFLPTALASTSSEPALTLSSTLPKLLDLAHEPSARTPQRLPFNDHSLAANGTTQPKELTGTVQFLEAFRLAPRNVLQHLAGISPSFWQPPHLGFNPLPLSPTIPFAVPVSPFALDLGRRSSRHAVSEASHLRPHAPGRSTSSWFCFSL